MMVVVIVHKLLDLLDLLDLIDYGFEQDVWSVVVLPALSASIVEFGITEFADSTLLTCANVDSINIGSKYCKNLVKALTNNAIDIALPMFQLKLCLHSWCHVFRMTTPIAVVLLIYAK